MMNHFHGKTSANAPAGSMQGYGHTYDLMTGLMSLGHEGGLRQATIELAHITPGEKILEVGCGTGTLTLAAKKAGGAGSLVCGIDIAPDMVETARSKALKAGAEIDFRVARIQEIPFATGTFDLVLSSLMLHHVPGDDAKRQGMQEVLRVLRPGGRLLIVDVAPPANHLLRGLATLLVGHGMMAHGVGEYRGLLESVGFAAVETGPTKSPFLGYLSGKKP